MYIHVVYIGGMSVLTELPSDVLVCSKSARTAEWTQNSYEVRGGKWEREKKEREKRK